jgi:hypothetical protein
MQESCAFRNIHVKRTPSFPHEEADSSALSENVATLELGCEGSLWRRFTPSESPHRKQRELEPAEVGPESDTA